MLTPIEVYQSDLTAPDFHADAGQQEAVEQLQSIYDRLIEMQRQQGVLARWFTSKPAVVKGLYLYGGPGRGKTYLMDCFYDSLPFANKRRVHFHRFMLEIHTMLERLPKTANPLQIVARQLAAKFRVICLDEFLVTDIADAMLLAGLLDALFKRGVTLVATSNTAPQDLYKDGLQRDRFLPAIELILQHTAVMSFSGSRDFRMALLQKDGTYLVSEDGRATEWLRKVFNDLALLGGQPQSTLLVHGREFSAIAIADSVIWFEFDELCIKPRSARDYLELAQEFHTVLLHGVPIFDDEMDEAARRFMHMIDAFYDHGVKLIASAVTAPEDLYQSGRLARPFERTASRLQEMSSQSYLARPHRPQ